MRKRTGTTAQNSIRGGFCRAVTGAASGSCECSIAATGITADSVARTAGCRARGPALQLVGAIPDSAICRSLEGTGACITRGTRECAGLAGRIAAKGVPIIATGLAASARINLRSTTSDSTVGRGCDSAGVGQAISRCGSAKLAVCQSTNCITRITRWFARRTTVQVRRTASNYTVGRILDQTWARIARWCVEGAVAAGS